ncbi:MAG TPA: HIT family protein [Candidatus Paceibacterota bacterium]|jgi:diadenosine tetraphosphate (Ap4A) HIT family hydrolase
MECAFCDNPEVNSRTAIENDLAFAFPTNIPITPGHMLVSPKRHVEYYEDLTAEERLAIDELHFKLLPALRSAFGAEGFNLAWNHGEAAGQAVPHFHLHIVPRKQGDTGIYQYDPRVFLYRPGSRATSPNEELDEVVKSIRGVL